MNRKLIITKTILFIIIVAFISGFKSIFGDENVLIGVTTITTTLILLERDLTISKFKNFLELLVVNVLMLIGTYFAGQNIILGAVINFIVLFSIAYLYSYDLRKPVFIGFGLQYLFMLATPIDITHMPMRLMATLSGPVIIMGVQVIFNKNKLSKVSEKSLVAICDELIKKISLIRENKDTEECSRKIYTISKELKLLIYDNRKDDFYISDKGKTIINILFSLERLDLISDRYNNSKEISSYEGIKILKENIYDNNKSLDIIQSEIEKIKSCIINKSSLTITENKTNDVNLQELYNLIENIQECLDEYSRDKNKNDKQHRLEVPLEYKVLDIHKRNFNVNSLRFRYALKLGIAVSISGLIFDYLGIYEARWVVFTVFSLVRPYTENCLKKTKQRVVGTLIGTVLIIILFSIIQDPAMRGLVLLVAGYISSYVTNYQYLIICVTVSAVGGVAITGGITDMSFARILYVIIGSFLAIAIDRLILPYDIKSGHNYVLNMYKDVVCKMVDEINEFIKGHKKQHNIKNLVLISALIEDRLLTINAIYRDDSKDEFVKNHRLLISNMYDLYINIKGNISLDKKVEEILTSSDYISNYNLSRYSEVKDAIIDCINETEDIRSKVICINLLEILEGINYMYEESESNTLDSFIIA